MPVKIFYDPEGSEIDSLGSKTKSGDPADGDTPYVRMPIRMLGIDTPETSYPTIGSPVNTDQRFADLADWIQQGDAPVTDELGAHLVPRLSTGTAGTLQKTHGEAAKLAFKDALDARLGRPNGKNRSLFVYGADEPFDSYGRLLAYIAPKYSTAELPTLTRHDRRTFNLEMIENGWAATLMIYPSLPKLVDLEMTLAAATKAVADGLGAWADSATMLTGYEWRMCVKLWKVTNKIRNGENLKSWERDGWIERYCIDITTAEIYQPQDYVKVPPASRAFIFPNDVRRAVGDLNLTPGT